LRLFQTKEQKVVFPALYTFIPLL